MATKEEWRRDQRKAKMRLYDDVQPPRTDEAVRARESQAELIHDFGNANGCRSRHANAAVDKRGRAFLTSIFYRRSWSAMCSFSS